MASGSARVSSALQFYNLLDKYLADKTCPNSFCPRHSPKFDSAEALHLHLTEDSSQCGGWLCERLSEFASEWISNEIDSESVATGGMFISFLDTIVVPSLILN